MRTIIGAETETTSPYFIHQKGILPLQMETKEKNVNNGLLLVMSESSVGV